MKKLVPIILALLFLANNVEAGLTKVSLSSGNVKALHQTEYTAGHHFLAEDSEIEEESLRYQPEIYMVIASSDVLCLNLLPLSAGYRLHDVINPLVAIRNFTGVFII